MGQFLKLIWQSINKLTMWQGYVIVGFSVGTTYLMDKYLISPNFISKKQIQEKENREKYNKEQDYYDNLDTDESDNKQNQHQIMSNLYQIDEQDENFDTSSENSEVDKQQKVNLRFGNEENSEN